MEWTAYEFRTYLLDSNAIVQVTATTVSLCLSRSGSFETSRLMPSLKHRLFSGQPRPEWPMRWRLEHKGVLLLPRHVLCNVQVAQ